MTRSQGGPVGFIRGSTARTLSTATTVGASTTVVVVLAAVLVVTLMEILAARLAIAISGLLASGVGLRRTGDGARDVFGRVVNVELLVDVLRNRLDFSAEFLLNLVQIEPILPVDEVDGETQVSESTGTANTVQIGFRVLGEVEVDHDVDRLDIDTTSQQVRADEVAAYAVAEIMEHAVTVLLKHPGVRIEARVTQLSDLLRQKFHAVG